MNIARERQKLRAPVLSGARQTYSHRGASRPAYNVVTDSVLE